MQFKPIPYGVKDPAFTTTIDLTQISKGVFVYLVDGVAPKHEKEPPLYYQPDGKGGVELIYPDKPSSGRSWKF